MELAVPWAEVVAGSALVVGIGARSGRAVAIVLCVLFALVLALLPVGMQCSCFGLFGSIEHRGLHLLVVGALVGLLSLPAQDRRRVQ